MITSLQIGYRVNKNTQPAGGGVELGWREATGKKRRRKKKGGKKPQEAVALADLEAELSTISIGDSQAQGQGEK